MPFAETVATLLAAHLLGAFVFQPNWLLVAKGNTWWGLPIHVSIVLVISVLLLGNTSWQMIALLGASHLILDSIKVFVLPKILLNPGGPWPFSIDQLLHFAFIVIVGLIWSNLFADGWWGTYLPVTPAYNASNWYVGTLVLLSGLILCVPVGGILIGKITTGMIDDDDEEDEETPDNRAEKYPDDTNDSAPADADYADTTATAMERVAIAIETATDAYSKSLSAGSPSHAKDESLSHQDEAKIEHILRGLPGGGRYIGWLERMLVLLFVLSGYPQGIGFLIAAKSILRFGDIKNWHQRAATEYVIIGTFLSFAWAMIVAGLTQQALQIWFPPKPPAPTVIELTSGVAISPDGSSTSAATPAHPATTSSAKGNTPITSNSNANANNVSQGNSNAGGQPKVP